jgi:hypothetical protein
VITRNTFLAKLLRQVTAFLPAHKSRSGTCKRCGACCKLPYQCPSLRTDAQGHSRCAIYFFRPLSCRKYPRTRAEHLTQDVCPIKFDKSDKSG